MIKSFTAVTREIDDAAAAVAEIKAALDFEKNLLKNSIGLISCFSEFAETGVLKAICEAMPFACIGSTTCICSAGKETEQIMLAIMVLTSDDCNFEAAALPITEKYEESINSALSPVLGRSGEKPALLLAYLPLMNMVSGDMIITAIDKITGGIPIFGTTAVDHNMDYHTAQTIYNGEAFRETAVLGLVCGALNYSFEIASLDEDSARKQKAIITESNGNILMGVNGKTAQKYFEEVGLTQHELTSVSGILPLVIDHKDGTKPVARAFFALTPDEHAVCGGAMPVGATLAIGHVVANDVLNTTQKAVRAIVEKECAILSYSCLARFIALSVDNTAEAGKIAEVVEDTPYIYAVSGGEICPLMDANGKLKNVFHNYTNVFCKMS